jgi:phosphoribosyl 1,2-cyclic phosphodiesterase
VRVVSLASGSSGNALLVEHGATRVLVDAGLAPRMLAARLRQAHVAADTLCAILLTHEHYDHTCGAVGLACQHGIPLVTDMRTYLEVMKLPSALQVGRTPDHDELRVGRRKRVDALEVRSFAVSHDAAAPCGYVLSAGGWNVFVGVDTGEVTRDMAEAMRAAHLLVIEANHDEVMLERGPYPRHLKQRIRGANGHLSNAQTALALGAALDGGPRWVWLAHLSKTNNRPALAVETVHRHLQTLGQERVVLRAAPPDFGPEWESPATPPVAVAQPSLWGDGARPVADVMPAEAAEVAPARGATVGSHPSRVTRLT